MLSPGSVLARRRDGACSPLARHPAVMVVGLAHRRRRDGRVPLRSRVRDALAAHRASAIARAVTALTLFGGFASTVFWPLSHLLLEAWGWRVTFGIYAGLHLFLCLPIHRLFVPKHSRITPATRAARRRRGASRRASRDPRLVWLTAELRASPPSSSRVIAVHLISLLTTAGLTAAQAVTISMLVGPMQVAGRIIELGFSGRVRAVTVGLVAFALMLLALVALISVEGFGIAAIVFVIAYGCGNGVLTIVKGTAPVELFGPRGPGRAARPPLARRPLREGDRAGVVLGAAHVRAHAQRRARRARRLAIAGMGSYSRSRIRRAQGELGKIRTRPRRRWRGAHRRGDAFGEALHAGRGPRPRPSRAPPARCPRAAAARGPRPASSASARGDRVAHGGRGLQVELAARASRSPAPAAAA